MTIAFMAHPAEELKRRTKQLAVRVVRLYRALPKSDEARIIGRQILRSATSVAANYRAVCRARSKPEFIAKMGTVIEETDETLLWIELIVETGIVPAKRMLGLSKESGELLSIFVASRRTARLALAASRRG